MISSQQRRSTTDVGNMFLAMSVRTATYQTVWEYLTEFFSNVLVHPTAFRQTHRLYCVYRRSDEVSEIWKKQSILALDVNGILNEIRHLKERETTEF